MAIEDRNLSPGTKLAATYKKVGHKAEVIAGDDGKVRYRLDDGREFKSPSSAGTAITGKACNGWTFWSVEESYKWADAVEGDNTADVGQEIGHGGPLQSDGILVSSAKGYRCAATGCFQNLENASFQGSSIHRGTQAKLL